jgi:hypothetical protein
VAEFDSNGIGYARVGAGTTGIHNACDRASTFRETKRRVRKIRTNQIDVRNELLRKSLVAVFGDVKTKYPNLRMSSSAVENIIQAMEALVNAYQHVMIPTVLRHSFECSGQHCPPDKDGVTIDATKMVYQCYTDIPADAMQLMMDKLPELAEHVLEEGKPSWARMDASGIPVGTTSINRDELTHVRHWAEIVTHKAVREAYRDEVAVRDPAVIAQKRKVAAAQKLVANNKKKMDAHAAQQQKREAKQAEKERFAALSPAEQVSATRATRATASATRATKRAAAAEKDQLEKAELQKAVDYLQSVNVPLAVHGAGGAGDGEDDDDDDDEEEEADADDEEREG